MTYSKAYGCHRSSDQVHSEHPLCNFSVKKKNNFQVNYLTFFYQVLK